MRDAVAWIIELLAWMKDLPLWGQIMAGVAFIGTIGGAVTFLDWGYEKLIAGPREERVERERQDRQENKIDALDHLLRRPIEADSERILKLRVHRAFFVRGGPECYFVTLTNLSPRRPLEVTHIWYEDEVHHIPIRQPARPLPVRLDVDQIWETWIALDGLPVEHREAAETRFRARLSSGEIVSSEPDANVPPIGVVPGGPISVR
jgi:hypothetical protein